MTDWLAGIDVGGTFTDVVARESESGRFVALKVPSESGDPSRGFFNGLRKLGEIIGGPVDNITHATTIGTNAVLEGRGAVTALVTTRNFRDVLEIGRSARRNLYDLFDPGRPAPIVPDDLRLEITERIAHDGTVLLPLAIEEIDALVQQLKMSQVEAIAICLINGHTNPQHEQLLKETIGRELRYVSASCEIRPTYGEYERTSTVVLNAYLMPIIADYLAGLVDGVAKSNPSSIVRLVQSNGGLMTVESARQRPLLTALSGPAAGVTACQRLARLLCITDAVTLDMGGTSTDVCMIRDAEAAIRTETEIGGRVARIPALAIETIGAGGGSVAYIDAVGALKVGPRSAGSLPGPCCYDLGGEECTVTDANLVLGYLNPEAVLGGAIKLKPQLSAAAIGRLAGELGTGQLEAAAGIVEVVNSSMIHALRLVTVQKGIDVRQVSLIAFGGAGPIHAGRLAQELDIPKVIIPACSSSFSAFGCIQAEIRYEAMQTMFLDLSIDNMRIMAARMEELNARICDEARRDRIDVADMVFEHSVDLRYSGQKQEIEILVDAATDPLAIAELERRFRARHAEFYSYATNDPIQCVNIRARGYVPNQKIVLPKRTAATTVCRPRRRRVFFPETGPLDVAVLDREGIGVEPVPGPAIVEDEWSTIVVYPGQMLTVDPYGNIFIAAGAAGKAMEPNRLSEGADG